MKEKIGAEIEDVNDESLIGKVNNDTLKIIEATIDRKLALAKLQTQIISTDNKDTDNTSQTDNSFTDQDKHLLRELFNEKKNDTNTDYDLD